jgi:hypothetical protein
MRNSVIPTITQKQRAETGILLTAGLIVSGLLTNNQVFYILSLGSAMIGLMVPMALHPLAVLWFGLSKILGAISSRILLAVIFFLVVTPLALVRRASGKDNLNLKKFKKGSTSAFVERTHNYEPSDMEHQY